MLRPRLHESGNVSERRKTCTDPPFVYAEHAVPCKFWTADSTATCNRILTVSCKRGGKEFVRSNIFPTRRGLKLFVRWQTPLFLDNCASSGHLISRTWPIKVPLIDVSGWKKNFACLRACSGGGPQVGRWGNPLSWGNPSVHIISHMITPSIM